MLFYVKKYLWLDLVTTIILSGLGCWGIWYFDLSVAYAPTMGAIFQGFVGFLLITAWTFTGQSGYVIVKGEDFAQRLTQSLAKEYANASILKAIAAGITAALGEEIFFRGFIQQKGGLFIASFLFGLAHYGKKDIRPVSHWSFAHGLFFGMFYTLTGNLSVPLLAHGLFDIGGVIYFRRFMRGAPK